MSVKGTVPDDGMNNTERAYSRLLEQRKVAGELLWWGFEKWTFKIAKDTRYTPDFCVMLADGTLQAHEVKGHKSIFRDDAKVKIKTAAAQIPLEFFLIFPVKGGSWDIQLVK